MLYFINTKSKRLISDVSISRPDEEIMMTYKKALSKADE